MRPSELQGIDPQVGRTLVEESSDSTLRDCFARLARAPPAVVSQHAALVSSCDDWDNADAVYACADGALFVVACRKEKRLRGSDRANVRVYALSERLEMCEHCDCLMSVTTLCIECGELAFCDACLASWHSGQAGRTKDGRRWRVDGAGCLLIVISHRYLHSSLQKRPGSCIGSSRRSV